MRVKEYLSSFVRREILLLKSLKTMFWIPLILVDVFVPVFAFYLYKTQEISSAGWQLQTVLSIIVPITSVWWPIFLFRVFIETKGNEIFFVMKKSVFAETFVPFLLFEINTFLIMSIFAKFFPLVNQLLPVLLPVTFFLFGLAYFVSFLSGSVTITILINVVYILINSVTYTAKPIPFIYTSAIGVTDENVGVVLIPIAVVGIIFLTLGIILNSRFKSFK